MSDDNSSFGVQDAEPARDSVTETTSQSWFQRIGGAFSGVLVGLLFVPLAAWLLWWNEGRAVQTAQSLAEGAGAVVAAGIDRIDPNLEGRLVHLSGPLRVAGALRDDQFGVTAPGAARLVRTVEMYQWKEESRSETRTKLGGGTETVTTYSYTRTWSATPIDSSRFREQAGHQNPPMRFQGREQLAPEARIGAWRLAEPQLRELGTTRRLEVTRDDPNLAWQADMRVEDGRVLFGDPAAPRVGDLRIAWTVAQPEQVSIVARQTGDGLTAYQTRAGDRLMLVSDRAQPASEMIREAEEGNRFLTWILRGVGVLVMLLGFGAILAPIKVLADVIPPLGAVVGFGTGLVAGLLTLVFAPLAIALAWLWYRPLVGIAVLAVGVAGAVGMAWLGRRRRAARAAASAPPWSAPGQFTPGR
jgi:hypothetical protein